MKPIGVALLGFGNVGRAFARYLRQSTANSGFNLTIRAVADSSGGLLLDNPNLLSDVIARKESGLKLRQFAPQHATDLSTFIDSLPTWGIQVAVESLPTNLKDGQPALDLINAALFQGTHVVTVDKGPLVHGFETLRTTSLLCGANLAYNGTMGVKPPTEIAGDPILEIAGVLNGTTNHILTEMLERALPFSESLSAAQAEGIVEPDPSLDIQGWDTACKIVILASSVMGAKTTLAEVTRVGIGSVTEALIANARAYGKVVRLIGRARTLGGAIRLSVGPEMVGPDSPFYSVRGTSKAALFQAEKRGELLSMSLSSMDSICKTILEDLRSVIN